MLRRIRTSTRNERPVAVALAALSAALLALLAIAAVAGDQRQVRVVLIAPASGDEAPQTLQAVTFTFSQEPDLERLSGLLTFDPPVSGTLRVRGRTADYVFDGPLEPGAVTATITSGAVGRAGEHLETGVSWSVVVRDAGIAYVQPDATGETVVVVRDADTRPIVSAPQIRSFAVAPNGLELALVTEEADGSTALLLVDTDTLEVRTVLDDPAIQLADVTWAPDGSAMLVARRDIFPDGSFGVERIWLIRVDGTFAGQVDREENPSFAPAWAPDGQSIAYVSPTTEEVVMLRLGTGESTPAGTARGRGIAWSPDSQLVAFESIPAGAGEAPVQPVSVVRQDGTVVLTLGGPNEIISQPRFIDAMTLVTLWREVGVDSEGTELRFTNVETGITERAVPVVPAPGLVLSWALDPAGERIVYNVRDGAATRIVEMELATGESRTVVESGLLPRWLP